MTELKVEKHKVVSFTYCILDEMGAVHEQIDKPMSYVHGVDNRVFPEVLAAIEDAKIGDIREVKLLPEQGFGEYDEGKTFRDKIKNVPPEFLKIGAKASFQNEQGEQLTMTVKAIKNGEIFLDGNHPFAGKTMIFKITVSAIRDASAAEIDAGLSSEYSASTSILH